MDEMEMTKCVCIGDGGVGKTCMLISYSTNEFPEEYVPTVFDNYYADVEVDGEKYNLSLWDTAGQEEYDRLRPLSYPYTDVFIVCYSVTSRSSLNNVVTKWVPEMRTHCPDVPFIIIGSKCDIRTDKCEQQKIRKKELVCEFASFRRAKEIGARLGAKHVAECSAKTQHGLKSVFDQAVKAALNAKHKEKTKKRKKCSLL